MRKIQMKTKFKLLSIIICALLLLTTTLFSGCFLFGSDDEPKLFTRDATNNDVYIDLSEDFALSINYTVTPKVDINNLQLTFKYYTKSNELLTTKTKSVGNVSKNIEYTVSVSLSEFSIFDLFKFYYTSMAVTGGTVSIFA